MARPVVGPVSVAGSWLVGSSGASGGPRLTDVGAGRCRDVCRSDCQHGMGCRVGSPLFGPLPVDCQVRVGLQPALKRLGLTDVGAGRCRDVCRSDCQHGMGGRVGFPLFGPLPVDCHVRILMVGSRLQVGSWQNDVHGTSRRRSSFLRQRSTLARPVQGPLSFAGGWGIQYRISNIGGGGDFLPKLLAGYTGGYGGDRRRGAERVSGMC